MITGVPAALPRRNLVGEIPEDNKKQAVFTACLFGGDAGFVARYERISERTFPSRERQPDDNRGSRGIAAPQPRW